jgi:hypothetical protein
MSDRWMRNNNPGNIRINRNNHWDGKISIEQNTDGIYEQFISMNHGICALISCLRNEIRSGRNTISSICESYASPSSMSIQSCIRSVSQRLGISAYEPISYSKNIIREIAQAICRMQNGINCISDHQFEEAWSMISESRRSSASQDWNRSERNWNSSISAGNKAFPGRATSLSPLVTPPTEIVP